MIMMIYIPHQSGERVVDINYVSKVLLFKLYAEGQQFYEKDSECDVGLREKCIYMETEAYGKYQKYSVCGHYGHQST